MTWTMVIYSTDWQTPTTIHYTFGILSQSTANNTWNQHNLWPTISHTTTTRSLTTKTEATICWRFDSSSTIMEKGSNTVLLCLDTNKDITKLSFKNSIGTLLAQTDLVDLHAQQHPNWPCPAAHQWGLKPIDIYLASPAFVRAVTKTYILPFQQPITMLGNHHMIGANFDPQILFGTRS